MRLKPSILLRPALVEDAPAMRRLVRAAYAKYVERIGREPQPMTSDFEELARSGRCVLATWSGSMVGLLAWEVEGDAVLIENLAVSPEAQGRGVGTLLLGYAEDVARSAGRSRLRLFTNAAMTENLDYYPRHGFLPTRGAEEQGFSRVYFERELSDCRDHQPGSGS